ncbi:MAG: IS200/IS605 family accessory protein TnpB-related protein, partial [Tychonema bourrellyi B0820]|nr:IS200/IS605 family accessory protein TnpB-related protein [Tychonema bourrellyi B0820]
VIGKNAQWKNELDLGRKTNQSFVNIPHARLIEMLKYKAELMGIKIVEVSTQADKSFCFGKPKLIPYLSIEVVYTSGGLTKLPKYRALGVPEIWFWEDGILRLYHLREDKYEEVIQSQLSGLETLDIDLLRRCILMGETNLAEAVKVFGQGISTVGE